MRNFRRFFYRKTLFFSEYSFKSRSDAQTNGEKNVLRETPRSLLHTASAKTCSGPFLLARLKRSAPPRHVFGNVNRKRTSICRRGKRKTVVMCTRTLPGSTGEVVSSRRTRTIIVFLRTLFDLCRPVLAITFCSRTRVIGDGKKNAFYCYERQKRSMQTSHRFIETVDVRRRFCCSRTGGLRLGARLRRVQRRRRPLGLFNCVQILFRVNTSLALQETGLWPPASDVKSPGKLGNRVTNRALVVKTLGPKRKPTAPPRTTSIAVRNRTSLILSISSHQCR